MHGSPNAIVFRFGLYNFSCQNTAVVVGDHVAELRPYICSRKIIYSDFLGSATTSVLFLF